MMLAEMSSMRADLGPAETRLADFVITNGSAVTRLTLAELARQAEVSEPTVLRLIRKFGTQGFPEFKVKLAQELATGSTYLHRDIAYDDSVGELSSKVLNAGIFHLSQLRETLDVASVERSIELLARAHRIDFFAIGQSTVVAIDAQQKFMFLEVPSIFQLDTPLQIMSASVLTSTDVAVCFSFTGTKRDIIHCAEAARDAGAAVIAVTRSDTPLARAATVTVPINIPESDSLYAPVATRLAHLAIVDILATGVAIRRGPGVTERIRRMKASLGPKEKAS